MILILAGVALTLIPSPAGPLVEATVDGRRTRLLVDTGASRTVLARRMTGELVSLKTAGLPVEVTRFSYVTVKTGSRVITEGYALPSLIRSLPRRTSGVAGNDLLLRGPVLVDGPANLLEFDPVLPTAPGLPMAMRNGVPIVRADLALPGHPPLIVEVLLDTGSTEPLLLTQRLARDLELGESALRGVRTVKTASGTLRTRDLTVHRFSLAGREWLNPPAAMLTGGDPPYDAIVGWPLLKEIKFTLDPLGAQWWRL